MTEKLEIWKCEICGNIVEVVHDGVGQLVCCGEPMKLMDAHTEDAGLEKHVPVVEKTADGIKVKVGEVAHPMEAKHFIEWVEVIANGKTYRKFLEPGQQPEATFCLTADTLAVREYCNIHGLWKTEV
ncbi:MAG TPA: desulfoferrodoxin [archaeon]|nr:desulfoferrodoxin [archaeon]